jgi:hypothetical protein
MSTSPSANDSQSALPAEAKTNRGSRAIAALGAMLATDWARTSGVDSTLFFRVVSPVPSVVMSGSTVEAMAFLLGLGRRGGPAGVSQ